MTPCKNGFGIRSTREPSIHTERQKLVNWGDSFIPCDIRKITGVSLDCRPFFTPKKDFQVSSKVLLQIEKCRSTFEKICRVFYILCRR